MSAEVLIFSGNRCGHVRKFTIECCHVCNVPKAPAEHWWKCQNKNCEAFDKPSASSRYFECYVPIADIALEPK